MYAAFVSPALCDCTTLTYTLYPLMFSVSHSQTPATLIFRLTSHTGYGAAEFIIMSVEGGVGVACGCLPGCKPLMNKLFPRVFGNKSQSSLRHRPSENFVVGKSAPTSSSSAAKSKQESHGMQIFPPGDRGSMIAGEQQQSDIEERLPTVPQSSHQGLQPPSRSTFTGRRPVDAYRVLQGNESDSSMEISLLQRH
jgi:hypothetical protein